MSSELRWISPHSVKPLSNAMWNIHFPIEIQFLNGIQATRLKSQEVILREAYAKSFRFEIGSKMEQSNFDMPTAHIFHSTFTSNARCCCCCCCCACTYSVRHWNFFDIGIVTGIQYASRRPTVWMEFTVGDSLIEICRSKYEIMWVRSTENSSTLSTYTLVARLSFWFCFNVFVAKNYSVCACV